MYSKLSDIFYKFDNMKKIVLLFVLSFLFALIGQILWMIGILSKDPLFGSQYLEEWFIYLPFTLFSVFGLFASYKWYKKS